jgi:hypothetical protein
MSNPKQITLEQKVEAFMAFAFFMGMCVMLGIMFGPMLWAYIQLNSGLFVFLLIAVCVLWIAVCYEIDARKKRAEFMWHINNLHRRIDEIVPAYMIPQASEGGNDEGSAARI